jgi:hypothetical protein
LVSVRNQQKHGKLVFASGGTSRYRVLPHHSSSYGQPSFLLKIHCIFKLLAGDSGAATQQAARMPLLLNLILLMLCMALYQGTVLHYDWV